jgi:hypothetical protein
MIAKILAIGGALFLGGLVPLIAAPNATNSPASRLTVELRDGSRVIGSATGKSLRFRSGLLGELKLAVKDIRLVDAVAIYNRALPVGEIQAICTEENKGELPPVPQPGKPFQTLKSHGSGF